jgi:hypothetical protein
MAITPATKKSFSIEGSDRFYLWEALQGIDNGRTRGMFAVVDNFYLYQVIISFQPGGFPDRIISPDTLTKAQAYNGRIFDVITNGATNTGAWLSLDTLVGMISQFGFNNWRLEAQDQLIRMIDPAGRNVVLDSVNDVIGLQYFAPGRGAVVITSDARYNVLPFSKIGITESGIRERTGLDKEEIITGAKVVTVGGNLTDNVSGSRSESSSNGKVETVSGLVSTENCLVGKAVNVSGGTHQEINLGSKTTQADSITETSLGASTENIAGTKTISAAKINLAASVPEFASNAAAIVGGLVVGDLYRTTVLGDAFIKIVI